MNNKTIAILAIVVIAGSALAQGGGQRGGGGQQGGGQRGGGFGGGQFGQGQRGGQNFMVSESMLVQRADVQKDIKLTPEQKTKIDAINTEMREKMQAQFQGFRGGQGGGNNGGQAGTRGQIDMEAIQKQMEALQKESNDKTKAVLTEEQWKRLGQIKVQLAGSRIFLDEAFAKQLGLKANQKLDIQDLMDKQQEANRQIMAKFREEGADREKLMKDMQDNDKILRAEIEKLLTAEQKTLLTSLEGPKFTPDPNQQGGFGGGGFGGGGFGGGRNGGGTGGGGGRGGSTGGGR